MMILFWFGFISFLLYLVSFLLRLVSFLFRFLIYNHPNEDSEKWNEGENE
jgi:hypothetical protein